MLLQQPEAVKGV